MGIRLNQDFLDSLLKINTQISVKEAVNLPAIYVPVELLHGVLSRLKSDFKMEVLLDHTATDFIEENSFELIYQLFSARTGQYLSVYTRVKREEPLVESAADLWAIAEFQEREVFDFFGIQYQNHPDLRRLFLADDWQGFPLRKDYKDDFMLEFPDHD